MQTEVLRRARRINGASTEGYGGRAGQRGGETGLSDKRRRTAGARTPTEHAQRAAEPQRRYRECSLKYCVWAGKLVILVLVLPNTCREAASEG